MPIRDIAARKEYFRQYDKKRFARKRAFLLEGKSCIRCGFDDVRALEFHHRDPSNKLFSVMRSLTKNMNDLLLEIKKCDLICANCHAIEHSATWQLQ